MENLTDTYSLISVILPYLAPSLVLPIDNQLTNTSELIGQQLLDPVAPTQYWSEA